MKNELANRRGGEGSSSEAFQKRENTRGGRLMLSSGGGIVRGYIFVKESKKNKWGKDGVEGGC